jgi:hypothetical protein
LANNFKCLRNLHFFPTIDLKYNNLLKDPQLISSILRKNIRSKSLRYLKKKGLKQNLYQNFDINFYQNLFKYLNKIKNKKEKKEKKKKKRKRKIKR